MNVFLLQCIENCGFMCMKNPLKFNEKIFTTLSEQVSGVDSLRR